MIRGIKIRQGREALRMTQQELAELLNVSGQAVGQWETGRIRPDPDRIPELAKVLGTTSEELLLNEKISDEQIWEPRDRMFSEENMYAKLRTFAHAEYLEQMYRALPFARDCHEGQNRYMVKGSNVKVPYIIHPLLMCCQAHALGIRDDVILTVILLHDVCEDCGLYPEELPFSGEVRDAVGLVTKDKEQFRILGRAKALESYYAGIRTNKVAMIVKCLDRCNNLSTMAMSFSTEKMVDYITETEKYIIPILDRIKEKYLDLNDAAFLLKYQIRSMMETQKVLIRMK